ncbi:putative TetR family transcriptional regulator [Gordonia effusa NBRC 100432]|uniref:Putative TetR family transcriptional regulator n=1 Tax=Gordonia effusa NBRC 100432 TaxID=1077974 RepID=H0R6I8_9ACTN|nr:TetR/AcrR family transcriptional regulator [Gordonia effusa]GAB20689.1 putative TetR family transcriptional regulator [Gordonia effusa NBRC 100432]
MARMDPPVGDLAVRRKANTRQRLLDAALAVFAERGFGQATVQQVCAAADFTRGAFYSNFSSLDELYLEVWRRESDRIIERLKAAGDRVVANAKLSLDDAIAQIDAGLSQDMDWFRVSTEFTVLATRRPELWHVRDLSERAIMSALQTVVDGIVTRLGRQPNDLDELCSAVWAVHDGTLVQCVTKSDPATARHRRAKLLATVVTSYTTVTS